MKISNYEAVGKGHLVGVFSVTIPSWNGLTINDCKLFEKDGQHWVGLPSREFLTHDGKKHYEDYLTMERDIKAKFDKSCLQALQEKLAVSFSH